MKPKFSVNYETNIVPKTMNPEVSDQLLDEVKFFQKWGYLIVENALTKKQIYIPCFHNYFF